MNERLNELQRRHPDLEGCIPSIQAAYDVLCGTFAAGGKLLICGNGGSAADSDHIVGELMKAFEQNRPLKDDMRQQLQNIGGERGTYLADRLQGALPAISLTAHAPLMTAISNDIAGDLIFAQQVFGLGKAGDTLIGISTSGNAVNVLHALHVARALNMHTIGLTGSTGGAMLAYCDIAVCVPYERTAPIQERHIAVYHALCSMLEEEFFG